ncbi:MAG: type II secretion system protein [Sneathiellaceae bacterium]
MHGRSEPADAAAGFLMIEVIVGLAIVSMAFAYGFPALSDALGRLRSNQDEAEALSLARSTLAQVGQSIPLQLGETAGRTEEGFDWLVQTEPYDRIVVSPEQGVAGYTVRVTVSWRDRSRTRDLSLTTVQLGRPRDG